MKASPVAGHPHAVPDVSFRVAKVPLSRPLVWLSRGWDDLLHHRGASLAYGLLVSALGVLILGLGRHPYYLAASTSVALLIGPIVAADLCELSRRRDHGEVADFEASLHVLGPHREALLGLAATLSLLSLLWFALSGLMLYLSIGKVAPDVEATWWDSVFAALSPGQLLAYLLVAGTLAAIVFALTVVAVPMIIDSGAEVRTAMLTSLRVTLADWPAMLLWAALVVLLVSVGFATWLLGMIVVFPLLAHASWYAYRELVH